MNLQYGSRDDVARVVFNNDLLPPSPKKNLFSRTERDLAFVTRDAVSCDSARSSAPRMYSTASGLATMKFSRGRGEEIMATFRVKTRQYALIKWPRKKETPAGEDNRLISAYRRDLGVKDCLAVSLRKRENG